MLYGMKNKLLKLHKIYGTWRVVAKKLFKTERQIMNYLNGYSHVSKELEFLIDSLLTADKLTK